MRLGKSQPCTNFEVDIASAIAKILQGTPKFGVASLAQCHIHFSLVCDFMMGLGKTPADANFEVASFSHCRNIIGEPQNFDQLP